MRGDRRERVVDEVRRDLRAQRAQLGPREPLALRLELGELDLRGDEARRLLHRARVLRASAAGCARTAPASVPARSPPTTSGATIAAPSGQSGHARRRSRLDVHAVVAPRRRPARRAHGRACGGRRRRRPRRARRSRSASATAAAWVSVSSRGAALRRRLLREPAAQVREHRRRRVQRRLHRVPLARDDARRAQQPQRGEQRCRARPADEDTENDLH